MSTVISTSILHAPRVSRAIYLPLYLRFYLQSQQEAEVLRVCQDKVWQRSLPMKIVDAEYQFDMHKLTLFFEAERCV